LAVLLVHRGEPVSSDRLIDELWGERSPAVAIKIVQGYVSNLRKVLGVGFLVSRGRGYSLQLDPAQLDVDRFEALVAKARSACTGDWLPTQSAHWSSKAATRPSTKPSTRRSPRAHS
jgi:DNA-binding SARP family transcriptional activator